MTKPHPTGAPVIANSGSQLMRLPVHRIQCYAGNPRRQINPEYDRLKASIRTEGLDQPLVVTQKPGETDYLLQAGGNTRLVILKALAAETGEARFESVDCLVKPWIEESAVLLAHLRENELRGELPFIDKAQAVFAAKRLFETELGVPDLSLRRLEHLLKERGFPLGSPIISKMGYAVHTLLPLIPQALGAGLGRPQVEKIRALERAASQLWSTKALGHQAEFTAIFATLCRRYDAPDWDLESLRNALENEIADSADESVQTIRLAIGVVLSGRALPVTVSEETDQPDPPQKTPVPFDQTSPNLSGVQHEATEEISENVHPSDKKPQVFDAMKSETGGSSIPPSVPMTSVSDASAKDKPEAIRSLRIQAWTLATRLAQRNGLGDLVVPLPDQGLGFLLRDVPDPVLAETLDPDLLGQVSTLWWQLAACAEMTVTPIDALTNHLDESSILHQALSQQDAGLLFERVWTLDPGQTGHQLWRQLNEDDWQDLLQLMETYRQLHRCAIASGRSLWEEAHVTE